MIRLMECAKFFFNEDKEIYTRNFPVRKDISGILVDFAWVSPLPHS